MGSLVADSHQKIAKYHSAVAAGRHPRSFPHQTQLWQFVRQSKQRLSSVKSGQCLPSLLIEQERSDAAAAAAAATNALAASDSGGDVGLALEHSVQSSPSALWQRKPRDDERGAVLQAKGYMENFESSDLRMEKMARRLTLFRERKREKMNHLAKQHLHPDLLKSVSHTSNSVHARETHFSPFLAHQSSYGSANGMLGFDGGFAIAEPGTHVPHAHAHGASAAMLSGLGHSTNSLPASGGAIMSSAEAAAASKRATVAKMARGTHLRGGAKRLRTATQMQQRGKRISVVGSMLAKTTHELGHTHRKSVVNFMMEQRALERKDAEMRKHKEHELMEEAEHKEHLQQAAALAHITEGVSSGIETEAAKGDDGAVAPGRAGFSSRFRNKFSGGVSGGGGDGTGGAGRADSQRENFEFTTAPDARIFYQSRVAFELVSDGSLLSVSPRTGEVGAAPMRFHPPVNFDLSTAAPPPEVGTRGSCTPSVVLFTLIKLDDPEFAGPIRLGDDVWLCVATGPGTPSWKSGAVLGAKVNSGANLQTVKQRRTSDIRNPQSLNEDLGTAGTVRAFVPQLHGADGAKKAAELTLGDLKREGEHNSRIRATNLLPLHIGRWTVQPAANSVVMAHRRAELLAAADAENGVRQAKLPAPQLCNGMLVYLEQDWFMLSTSPESADMGEGVGDAKNKHGAKTELKHGALHPADKDNVGSPGGHGGSHRIVLRQLPTKAERGETSVDRRSVWRMRLVQTSLEASNSKSRFHSMEELLYKARRQLRISEEVREGSRNYGLDLHSGSRFPRQIRRQRQQIEEKTEELYLSPEEDKGANIREYFEYKFDLHQRRRLRGGGASGRLAGGRSITSAQTEGGGARTRGGGAGRPPLAASASAGTLPLGGSRGTVVGLGGGGGGLLPALGSVVGGGSTYSTGSVASGASSHGGMLGTGRPWTVNSGLGGGGALHAGGGGLTPLREEAMTTGYGRLATSSIGMLAEEPAGFLRSTGLASSPCASPEVRAELMHSGKYVVPSSRAGGPGVKLAHATVFDLRQSDTAVTEEISNEDEDERKRRERRARRHSTLQLESTMSVADDRRVKERARAASTPVFERLLLEDQRLQEDIEYRANQKRFAKIFGSVEKAHGSGFGGEFSHFGDTEDGGWGRT